RVRQRSLAAYEHQDVPFEVLVERLNPARSLAYHPLVQVMLAWQGNDPTQLNLGGLQVTAEPVQTHTARMDLTFSMSARWGEDGGPAGIGGTVEFRTDVFDADTIRTLTERLRRVLVAMTEDPRRRLSTIDVLENDECERLSALGNRPALGRASAPVSVVGLFAAQVARTPDAVALTFEGESMTYRELDEAANRLANLLVERGAGPGEVVALLLSRSAEAVVAIVAVL
ncbi:AMP-binding protein, partial [Mycobacterium colombiense]